MKPVETDDSVEKKQIHKPKRRRKRRKPIPRKKKPTSGKRERMELSGLKKRILIGLGALLACALLVAAGLAIWNVTHKQKVEEVPEPPEILEEEPIENVGSIGENVLDHIIKAGQAVNNALTNRPAKIDLTTENENTFASIDTCEINAETGQVDITVSAEGIAASDDKYYYLFALNTYDTQISEDAEYIVKEYMDKEVTMSVNLNKNSASSRLYKKFVVAVKKDDKYVAVSIPSYITNPEATARYTAAFPTPASKKGLLVDPNKLRGNELDDLGVKHAAYNIPVARILGQSTSSAYSTIYYQYNGKSYAFNGQVIAEYDLVFGILSSKGITTTAIILNNASPAYPQMIHPLARSGNTQSQYYAFNAAEEGGVELIAAVGSFLAERYSGNTGHGKVANWVIANEINARKEWNYMQHVDLATYVEEYAKAYRVFYTAIKSVCANDRVYISIDQQWDRNLSNSTNYDGRDVLDEFCSNIKRQGDINWDLAQHPYSVPLTDTKVWGSSKYVTNSATTSMITMKNIKVLTDYMQQEQFLTKDGNVRHIILSEMGYTSTAGEAAQAAAFAYAYYKVESNPYLDSLILSRETDAGEEIAQGLALGLNGLDGHHKQIYNVFKYIDTSEHETYTEFAKSMIGISSWSEIK